MLIIVSGSQVTSASTAAARSASQTPMTPRLSVQGRPAPRHRGRPTCVGLLGSVRLLKPEQNSEKCLLAPGKCGAGGNWSQWRRLAPRISHVTWIKSCLPSGSRSPHLCNETGTSKGPHPDSDSGSQPSLPLPLPTSAPSPGLAPGSWQQRPGIESLSLNPKHTCPQPGGIRGSVRTNHTGRESSFVRAGSYTWCRWQPLTVPGPIDR